ncbi:nudix hydrolase [Lojkania enalia]|uniref:Nudix hydrolase n=1 Tax=Lojkania enalia TaxID=147567 RepID=A0A9P4K078_9PLEO|nr:nudix hydrolase [Didymosphaeria enalia]
MGSSGGHKSLLDLVKLVDNVPREFDFRTLYQLLLPNDKRPHGFMLPSTVSRMPWSPDFVVNSSSRTVQVLDSSGGKDTGGACVAAFQRVINAAINSNVFPIIHGNHSEMYKIIGANYHVQIERFPAPLFGIALRGAHMTAYVRTPSGIKIWVPRRSPHLFTYPNKLDTSVAGGVKADESPFECIVHEADEEASLPTDFVRANAHAVGAITYVTRSASSNLMHMPILYVFDIELPAEMLPSPKDDEVSEFSLLSVEDIVGAMLREEFKPNCVLVMIDFFVRHGIISPETESDYVDIVSRLRRVLPVPTSPEPQ